MTDSTARALYTNPTHENHDTLEGLSWNGIFKSHLWISNIGQEMAIHCRRYHISASPPSLGYIVHMYCFASYIIRKYLLRWNWYFIHVMHKYIYMSICVIRNVYGTYILRLIAVELMAWMCNYIPPETTLEASLSSCRVALNNLQRFSVTVGNNIV